MIGQRLTELRRRAKLSQRELGMALGLSHYTISAYEKERSEPSDDVKISMARYFNVSLDYLLGLIPEPLPISRTELSISVPEYLTPSQRQLLQMFLHELDIPVEMLP